MENIKHFMLPVNEWVSLINVNEGDKIDIRVYSNSLDTMMMKRTGFDSRILVIETWTVYMKNSKGEWEAL